MIRFRHCLTAAAITPKVADVTSLGVMLTLVGVGYTRCLGELVPHVPVLQAPCLGERHVTAEQRVLVDPADAGGVGTDLRCHALR